MKDYNELNSALYSLVKGVPYKISNLANASALLNGFLQDINWVGFYLCEDGKLVLGPFQGKVACIEIPFGKGVCGYTYEKKETVIVDNVHLFKGHIACDCDSNSEIVVPIMKNNEVVALLDIDSPLFSRFTEKDKDGLEESARILSLSF